MSAVEGTECPNCGETLETLRQERQQAGKREVVLVWYICSGCHHVALHHWAFADDAEVQHGLVRERRQRPSVWQHAERRGA